MTRDDDYCAVKVGDILESVIDDIGFGGSGVTHPQGLAVFIPGTIPGELVRYQIERVKRRYAHASIVKVIAPATERVAPRCPYYGRCGGCHFQHMAPQLALTSKVNTLQACLQRIAGLKAPDIKPITTSPQMWNYRNKLTFHRGITGAQGFIDPYSHTVVDIECCPIAGPDINASWLQLRDVIAAIPGDTMPFLTIRCTTHRQISLIASVTQSDAVEIVRHTIRKWASSQTIPVNTYVSPIPLASHMPLGKTLFAIDEQAQLQEQISQYQYRVAPQIFFQTNPSLLNSLLTMILKLAKELNAQRILEIYAGAGFFAIPLALQGHTVTALELDRHAIACAQESMDLNQVNAGQLQFRTGKASTLMQKLLRQQQSFDTALVDPPRGGLELAVIERLARLGIKNLIYVSCSPPTLARDTKQLAQQGFEFNASHPFDMFPQTYHMETVTLFHRQEAAIKAS